MADRSSSGMHLVMAALVLGASIVGSALILRDSIDGTSAELSRVLAELKEARVAAAPAPPPPAAARRRGPDRSQRHSVDLDGVPVKGAEEAKVTVVEFSDFQCPFCARVGPTLERIEATYSDDVRIAFKHLPLAIHPKAPAAHAAAEAAHRQGRFWEMHDRIFADQPSMSPEVYEKYAQEIGLDMDRFRRDVASSAVKQRVDADASEAAKLGVTGTPAFFINGRFVSGAQPFETFQRIIDDELDKS